MQAATSLHLLLLLGGPAIHSLMCLYICTAYARSPASHMHSQLSRIQHAHKGACCTTHAFRLPPHQHQPRCCSCMPRRFFELLPCQAHHNQRGMQVQLLSPRHELRGYTTLAPTAAIWCTGLRPTVMPHGLQPFDCPAHVHAWAPAAPLILMPPVVPPVLLSVLPLT